MNIPPLAIFAVLVVAFIGVPVALIVNAPPTATKAEYSRLKAGMSVSQAQATVGHPGHETAGEESGSHSKHLFTWINNDGSSLEATFENGKLTEKKHQRLK